MPDGFGPNFADLWAYYDRATSSWKMSQDCLPLTEDTHLVRSSVTWPTSGMTVNGRCYPLPTLAHHTSESASGLWPTPDASQRGARKLDLVESNATVRRRGSGQVRGIDLETAVKRWPTPTARDWKDGGYCPNVEVNGLLGRAVWPTPTTKANQAAPSIQSRGQACRNLRAATNGGALNPTWVEWLMGFPDGWTDLED